MITSMYRVSFGDHEDALKLVVIVPHTKLLKTT